MLHTLPGRWQDRLADRCDLEKLYGDVDDLYGSGTEPVFPKRADLFRAFDLTAFHDVRVVILGQDPYPRPEEADVLAFSMPNRGLPIPRSLCAVYSNIAKDDQLVQAGQRFVDPGHGDLTAWASRGVLLLNSALTVGTRPGSHKRKWRGFARTVLKLISEKDDPVVFLLWGAPAMRAAKEIRGTESIHRFSSSSHPAAWAPGRLESFSTVAHFSVANEHLQGRAIDWSLLADRGRELVSRAPPRYWRRKDVPALVQARGCGNVTAIH